MPAQKLWYVRDRNGFVLGYVHGTTHTAALRRAFNDYGHGKGIDVEQTDPKPRSGAKRNPGKSVRLSNFSGTITRNANGTVSVKGRKK